MSKRQGAGTSWVFSSDRVPENGQEVLVDYVDQHGTNFRRVGSFDYRTGWMIESNRLPDGWRVYTWMPIPEIPPF